MLLRSKHFIIDLLTSRILLLLAWQAHISLTITVNRRSRGSCTRLELRRATPPVEVLGERLHLEEVAPSRQEPLRAAFGEEVEPDAAPLHGVDLLGRSQLGLRVHGGLSFRVVSEKKMRLKARAPAAAKSREAFHNAVIMRPSRPRRNPS